MKKAFQYISVILIILLLGSLLLVLVLPLARPDDETIYPSLPKDRLLTIIKEQKTDGDCVAGIYYDDDVSVNIPTSCFYKSGGYGPHILMSSSKITFTVSEDISFLDIIVAGADKENMVSVCLYRGNELIKSWGLLYNKFNVYQYGNSLYPERIDLSSGSYSLNSNGDVGLYYFDLS